MADNKTNPSTGDRGKTSPNTNSGSGSSLTAGNFTSQGKAGTTPRFLVVKRIDEGNFDKVSPFVISKNFFGVVGNLKSIRKVKEGLLVETCSEPQAKRLLGMTKLDVYNIQVEPHRTLNFSKGVVTCADLLNCDEEEILREMESEGVIGVKRINKRVNGEITGTSSHILTFNRPKLPPKVKVAFYSLEVRPYIPNPLRCFNCQKFGHASTTCKDNKICACGKPPHLGQACQDPVKCVNCEGPHSAKSRKCPRMMEEMNIQNVKTLEKLSYAEARRKVCGPKRATDTTYAQITSNATLSQQLIPNLTKAIEDQIRTVINEVMNKANISIPGTSGLASVMRPPQTPLRGQALEKSGSVTDASQTTASEKRKRHEDNYFEDDSFESDDSFALSQNSKELKKGKTKRGWPLGKPRRNLNQ